MLVLSRKEDQQIVVDQRIRITVLQVRGSRVRIGIEAPADVPVRRSELPDREVAASVITEAPVITEATLEPFVSTP